MIEQITGYAVYCDRCGEEMEYDGYRPVFDSEQEAREAALAVGWKEVEYGKFQCPDCVSEMLEEDGNP